MYNKVVCTELLEAFCTHSPHYFLLFALPLILQPAVLYGVLFWAFFTPNPVLTSVSFPLSCSHTQRVFLRAWSGTKRLVVLAVDLYSDVLCCDLPIIDGSILLCPKHERSSVTFHLAVPSWAHWRWCSNNKTLSLRLTAILFNTATKIQHWKEDLIAI